MAGSRPHAGRGARADLLKKSLASVPVRASPSPQANGEASWTPSERSAACPGPGGTFDAEE